MLVDLSHLNEAGFWDVATLSTAPLVASHSNAHAVTPSSRNLTDRQLDAIRDSDGLVGLNFATSFLRPDGRMTAATSLDTMLRHLDHLIGKLGEDRVGFGSDFDGAMIPEAIGSAAGLPKLVDAMRAHGYDDALLEKLGTANWLRVLERTIG
jgi:membrane dipeptidase